MGVGKTGSDPVQSPGQQPTDLWLFLSKHIFDFHIPGLILDGISTTVQASSVDMLRDCWVHLAFPGPIDGWEIPGQEKDPPGHGPELSRQLNR